MSIVLWFDPGTGKILKVDRHPDWPEQVVYLNWYRDHPEEEIKGAQTIAVPPGVEWDGNPENWMVVSLPHGGIRLKRKDDWEIEKEIERAKEIALLEGALKHVSPKAKAKILENLSRLRSPATI